MNNSGASGVATSERKYDQTIQDIENQNMQVAIEVETPIVMGTSFNQQQHTVQDIENRNLEEFDGAPPNFVQQQHTVQDNDPNQNWQGVAPASPSLILQLPDTIQDDGRQTSEGVDAASPSVSLRPTIQVNRSEISEEFDEAPPNIVQQQHTDQGIAAASPSVSIQDNRSKTLEGSKINELQRALYEAVLHDNRDFARGLLEENPNLANEEITDTGDRALHLAISMKHTELAKYLIEEIRSDLELQDRQGYTACCYAAMMGMEEVARLMVEKKSSLVRIRSFYGTTPLELAVSYGFTGMAEWLLSVTPPDAFSREELFGLFLLSLHSKMFDLVIELLERDPSLAGMPGDDGRTALHILAQIDISSGWKTKDDGKMQPDLRSMVERLWECIRHTLEMDKVMELMMHPPILHDAARVGNVELITMITRDYPDLLLHIDKNGYSMFHVSVIYQQENMLELIKQARNIRKYSPILKDESGDNLLHLAGRLQHLKGLDIVAERDVQMQRAFAWFKAVEAIVPPFFLDMRNKDGYTPIELFWKEHRESLASSQSYMKTTAESCMLISTIILTLVFAAAFAPPGGFNQETGIPLLLKRNWFTCFIIFEALALFTSTYSIIGFWSIISSNYKIDEFFILPHHLRRAMCVLLLSVLCAISAFLSAFFLVFVGERKALVVSFMLPLYVFLVAGVSYQLFKVLRRNNSLQYYSRMGASCNNDGLWRRAYNYGASILSFFCSCF